LIPEKYCVFGARRGQGIQSVLQHCARAGLADREMGDGDVALRHQPYFGFVGGTLKAKLAPSTQAMTLRTRIVKPSFLFKW
jgi:hypothetical protein